MSEKFRCMKCKKNVKASPDCHTTYNTKNGKKFALKAECKECGTNLTRFCSEEDASTYPYKKLAKSVKKSARRSVKKSARRSVKKNL